MGGRHDRLPTAQTAANRSDRRPRQTDPRHAAAERLLPRQNDWQTHCPRHPVRNVVLSERPGFRGALRTTKSELRQENETFIPHVLAITRGSTVDFPNADPFFHNLFSLSSNASFNLGRYPRGQTRGQSFTKPGLVKVFCDIHSHMSASILVLDHPFFKIPAVDGSTSCRTYRRSLLIGWHERVGDGP